jgi:hypothetical protein
MCGLTPIDLIAATANASNKEKKQPGWEPEE